MNMKLFFGVITVILLGAIIRMGELDAQRSLQVDSVTALADSLAALADSMAALAESRGDLLVAILPAHRVMCRVAYEGLRVRSDDDCADPMGLTKLLELGYPNLLKSGMHPSDSQYGGDVK